MDVTGSVDRDRLRNSLCWLVAGAWAASEVASFVSRTYHPDPAINGLFGGMLTLLFKPWNNDRDGDS